MVRRSSLSAPVVALVVAASLSACTTGGSSTVTVLAAASLVDGFEELADAYEARTPGVEVRLAVAGSQQLATQVLEGAPADVFASADQRQMARVVEAGLAAQDPDVFAQNDLAIVVPEGNPQGIGGLEDLADPSLAVVLAAPEVPAGRYARQVVDGAGVEVEPVSLEADVRSVLAKVALGEADAGIVYTSDVVASDAAVDRVDLPAEHQVVADYPIAALEDGPNPTGGDDFVAFVHSDDALAILAGFGFRVGSEP